jgi:hypothetical protein
MSKNEDRHGKIMLGCVAPISLIRSAPLKNAGIRTA